MSEADQIAGNKFGFEKSDFHCIDKRYGFDVRIMLRELLYSFNNTH